MHDGSHEKPSAVILDIRPPDGLKKQVVAQVLVDRQEIYEWAPDGENFCQGKCELRYRVVSATGPSMSFLTIGNSNGRFIGNHKGSKISITGDDVQLGLPEVIGHRVGTYLMNEIVTWAKQWPSASINPIRLAEADASPENRLRRNRFYENFGVSQPALCGLQ